MAQEAMLASGAWEAWGTWESAMTWGAWETWESTMATIQACRMENVTLEA